MYKLKSIYTKNLTKILNLNKKGEENMVRKIRSDATVGIVEKTRGLPPGTIRNKNGRDTRSDKTVKTIRKESGKK